MERRQPLNRFDFDDQPPINEQINTESLRKCNSIEHDRERLLALHHQTTSSQALGEKGFVNGLEDSGTEVFVKVEAAIDRN